MHHTLCRNYKNLNGKKKSFTFFYSTCIWILKRKWSNYNLYKEKVYAIFETPTQHTCGVSRSNKKWIHVLKITSQQLKLLKIKRQKYPLNFQSPAVKTTRVFLFLKVKIFSLSLLSLAPLSLSSKRLTFGTIICLIFITKSYLNWFYLMLQDRYNHGFGFKSLLWGWDLGAFI